MSGSQALREIGRNGAGSVAASQQRQHLASRAWFEIYRTERVSLTSVLYSGDDWRWRFRSPAGEVLVDSEAYDNERTCRAAVMALQTFAGSARLASEA
jgi:uncharacterized protein YegP (UPF0339 family)